MDSFNNSQGYQNSSLQGRIINIATKVLMPVGLFLIAIISFLTSATEIPGWAYWIMAIYLVVAFLIILAVLAINFIPNTINWFSQRRFAKTKRQELKELSNELIELLASQRSNTIPYLIPQLASKLSKEVNILNCFEGNRQQFEILQSWTLSSAENIENNNQAVFLRDTAHFSQIVTSFSWACERVRSILNNPEVKEKISNDIVTDWNLTIQKISDFTSRVQRMMKSVNHKYNTRRCRDYFQDVKPL